METFPMAKRKDEAAHGEYRTKRVILEIYDAMQQAMDTGEPYQTRLDPPPADPRVAHEAGERQQALSRPHRVPGSGGIGAGHPSYFTKRSIFMTKWEYALITYSSGAMTGNRVYVWKYQGDGIVQEKGYLGKEPLLEALCKLGAEGWEAVSSATGSHAVHPGDAVMVVLKRPMTG